MSYTDQDLRDMRVEEVGDIATKKINSIMSDFEQRQSAAQLAHFALIIAEGGALTGAQETQKTNLLAKWQRINNLDTKASDIEARILALPRDDQDQTGLTLERFRPGDEPDWPE